MNSSDLRWFNLTNFCRWLALLRIEKREQREEREKGEKRQVWVSVVSFHVLISTLSAGKADKASCDSDYREKLFS